MPWCPKCKNEYVEGTEKCTDCGIALVETLKEDKAITFGEQEEMEESQKKENESEGEAPVLGQAKKFGVYQDSATKAEDNKSSGYTLLLVGGAGFVCVILCIAGVIPLRLSPTSQYMVYGVMGALFVLFLVMGVFSMRSSRIFAQKAAKEDSLTEEIRKWCLENLRQEMKEDAADNDSEEIKYFKRTAQMKDIISEKFLNLDEAYLEHFIDRIYTEIFEAEPEDTAGRQHGGWNENHAD